ncbi:MAG: hypothetical protein H8E40_03965 [Chloroflexi bacterium]|nr:hypothetical protein [Chloroflexota bacterium]
MTTHELARLLLALPDLPVATYAHNHMYMSGIDECTHGPLKVGLLETYDGQHIVIGDIQRMNINPPNWHISKMLHGDIWSGSHLVTCY